MTNREFSFIFRRSGESICHHFYVFLRAILGLYEKFIQQPDDSQVPFEIASNQRFYPYFKVNIINYLAYPKIVCVLIDD